MPMWSYMERGGRRAVGVWHRRAGKDDVLLHRTAVAAFQRVGSYWHALPEQAQARKAIWEAVNPHTGIRRIDEAFPPILRENTNDTEMFIRFKNGSTWRLVGSDRYDSLVGSSPAGVTFSEYGLANPGAWDYIRPMLTENKGWAAFISTPRGENHLKRMFDSYGNHPDRFAELLPASQTGAIDDDLLAEDLDEYISEHGIEMGQALFDQEYECSWVAAVVGAYFGAEIAKAEREGRVVPFEIDRDHPVHTVWDLGKTENNPIGCFQVVNGIIRLVDFYLPESDNLEDWCKWLADRGYHGNDYVPHDILTGLQWGTSRTRIDMLRENKRKIRVLPRLPVTEGLQAARTTINSAIFRDTEEVRHWISGIKNYRRIFDRELRAYRKTPVKDWAEHIGSMTRMLGLAWRDIQQVGEQPKPATDLSFTVGEDGVLRGSMTVEEYVRHKEKQRKANEF